jgi:hypothetical protein
LRIKHLIFELKIIKTEVPTKLNVT